MSSVASSKNVLVDFGSYDLTTGWDHSSVIALPDGRFVTVWTNDRDAIWGATVYQQIFGSDGQPEGVIQLITPDTRTGVGRLNSVTELSDGGWVVIWQADLLSSYPHFLEQAFNEDGTLRGPIGEISAPSKEEWISGSEISTIALSDGGWASVWEGGGWPHDLYMKVFDSDGSVQVNSSRIDTSYSSWKHEGPAKAVALEDGGWVVIWSASGGVIDGYMGTYSVPLQQAFNSDGSVRGEVTPVDISYPWNTSFYETNLVALEGGGWVVAFVGVSEYSQNIYQRAFNADGSAIGKLRQVSTESSTDQQDPHLVALEDGGWVLAWKSNDQAYPGYDIYMRAYNADGTARTPERLVNTSLPGDQYVSGLVALENGGWLITWSSVEAEYNDLAYMQAYTAEGKRDGNMISVNTSSRIIVETTALENGGWVVQFMDWRSSEGKFLSHRVFRPNEKPEGADLTADVFENEFVRIDVLSDAYDGDGDSLTISSAKILSGFGSVSIVRGHLVYDPRTAPNQNFGEGDEATVVIQYTITDGFSKDTAEVAIAVKGIEPDVFKGTNSGDTLIGSAGDDILYGRGGDDTLDGESGADRMVGGSGNDIYIVDNIDDTIVEAARRGVDEVKALVSYTLANNVEKLTLIGSDAIDGTGNRLANTITGNSGNNILSGGAKADTLIGGKGADELRGGSGADTLIGGAGGDELRGGDGRDTFVFQTALDLTVAAAHRDTIMDFDGKRGDRIDVSGIDTNMVKFGDQSFTFIGTDAFSHHHGELRYKNAEGSTFVYGDINGDGRADFAIQLDQSLTLVGDYFIL